MGTPIYRMYRGKMMEPWYRLSKKQQDALVAKVLKAGEKVGAKTVISCWSDWASEQWTFFGVEEFPSLEALIRLEELHRDLQWHLYVDAETTIGTKTD